MADFKDKNTGKLIKKTTYAALSASFTGSETPSGSTVDGRRFEHFTGSAAIKFLPHRVTQGPLNQLFPGLKDPKNTSHGRIDTASGIFRDTERKIVYIPLKKEDYLLNRIGPDSEISKSFGPNAYAQISASFIKKFTGVTADTHFLYAVEEFYTAHSGSGSSHTTESFSDNNVGNVTGSFEVFTSTSNDAVYKLSYSAVDNIGNGGTDYRGIPDFTFDFRSSSFATHWGVKFQNGDNPEYESTILFPTASVRFRGGNATTETSSIALTDSPFLTVASSSNIGNGTMTRINPNSDDDGLYVDYRFKSRIAGDADSGSLYDFDFLGDTQIIVYKSGSKSVGKLGSADFQYHATVRRAATGSSTIKTLYFYSGSGAGSEADPDYGFYVSESLVAVVGTNAKGTPVHKTNKLRRTADVGYYSPSGSQYSSSIYVQTASGATSGKGPVFAQLYETGN